MRKSILAGGVVALALSLLGGSVFAQQAPDRRAHADGDGDGRISQSEFVQRRVERFSRLDADRDGSVAPAEVTAGMAARRVARMTARFDRLDADRDGAINRAEFETAREGHEGRAGRHARRWDRMERRLKRRGPVTIEQAQTRAAEAFDRLDADRDGNLTIQERSAGREQVREARRAHCADPSSQAAPATE